MATQTLEGTWEEVAAHVGELAGRQVTVDIKPEGFAAPPRPNVKMLDAMRRAEEIQHGMNPRPESDGVALLREGREGAMYGDDRTG